MCRGRLTIVAPFWDLNQILLVFLEVSPEEVAGSPQSPEQAPNLEM